MIYPKHLDQKLLIWYTITGKLIKKKHFTTSLSSIVVQEEFVSKNTILGINFIGMFLLVFRFKLNWRQFTFSFLYLFMLKNKKNIKITQWIQIKYLSNSLTKISSDLEQKYNDLYPKRQINIYLLLICKKKRRLYKKPISN